MPQFESVPQWSTVDLPSCCGMRGEYEVAGIVELYAANSGQYEFGPDGTVIFDSDALLASYNAHIEAVQRISQAPQETHQAHAKRLR